MREFRLASSKARLDVDLTDFADLIINTVKSVIPKADVRVYKDRYTIDNVTKGESIKIGRILSSTFMGQYCIQLYKLFCGTEIEEKEERTDMNKEHKTNIFERGGRPKGVSAVFEEKDS